MKDYRHLDGRQERSRCIGVLAIIVFILVVIYQWVAVDFIDSHEVNVAALSSGLISSLILGFYARKHRFGKLAIVVSLCFIVYLLVSYLVMRHALLPLTE